MFIKNLTIKNFRCFEDKTIKDFGVPNGSEGSGLNVLIGENGNGKTSVLEAIKLLTQSRLKTKNVFSIKDFYDIEKKVEIFCDCSTEFEVKRTLPKGFFKADGFYFFANLRQMDEKGNLVDQLVFDNWYRQSDSTTIMEPEKRLEVQNPFGSRFSEMQIVYLDKKRARSVSDGEHTDKFKDLLDDFNFQFSKNKVNFKESSQLNDDIRNKLIDKKSESDKILGKILQEFQEISSINVKLDHLNILEPFSNAFFAIRDEASHQQISISKLGSGFEMIFTILFLKNYYSLRNKKTIYLIDEPELHLHPKLQDALIKILLDISKTDQIIVSTHSPFLFKNLLSKKSALFVCTKDDEGKILIKDARISGWGIFEWSPSWGEINYFAYDLPTVEFHNELYGYVQEKTRKFSEREIESYFESKGINKSKKWIKEINGIAQSPYTVTLCSYVRHIIHHPENKSNNQYTKEEFRESIKYLIKILKS